MLTFEEFIEKISYDFKKVFPEVKVGENLIHLGSGVTHIELPLGSMYREYQMTDYRNTKELYVKIASEILNKYKFKVDYANVYPILKRHDFGINSKVRFYRKKAFLDIDMLFVSDMGETWIGYTK